MAPTRVLIEDPCPVGLPESSVVSHNVLQPEGQAFFGAESGALLLQFESEQSVYARNPA